MKAFELLKVNESLLRAMDGHSLAINDVRYIDMMSEFMTMTKDGYKKTYIIQHLADKYDLAERTLYRVIERMMQEIELN